MFERIYISKYVYYYSRTLSMRYIPNTFRLIKIKCAKTCILIQMFMMNISYILHSIILLRYYIVQSLDFIIVIIDNCDTL
jgi:hypothetical protein